MCRRENGSLGTNVYKGLKTKFECDELCKNDKDCVAFDIAEGEGQHGCFLHQYDGVTGQGGDGMNCYVKNKYTRIN